MRRAERASCNSAYQLFRAYLHTHPRRRVHRLEPKSDTERARLGLPLREPWFEVKPFDEKKKVFVLRLKDTLQAQHKQRMELAGLSLLRRELDVLREGKQRKMATYVRRFPAAFTLRSFFTPNNKKKTWCSFSADALKLLEEEDQIFEASEAFLVQKLRKILMISMKNRLPFATVDQVRHSLGFPVDFKESLVNKYPDVFLLKERKGSLYLELKEWDETLSISALEKSTQEGKYSKKSKKKRINGLTMEGNEQEASCEMDHEHNSSSREEDNNGILTEEGDLCKDRSFEHNHQQGVFSVGMHVKLEALSNVGLESYKQDMIAISSPGLDGDRNTENTRAEVKSELFNVSDLDSDLHIDDLSAIGWNEHESSACVDIDKDAKLQVMSDLGDTNMKGEKQLQSMHENSACLRFPWITKKGKQSRTDRAAEIESFQSLPYISPYRNSRELVLPQHKTLQIDKFFVGVIHEFLSLTLEKRATVQQLELFRRPYRLPVNLLDFLLKYDGIFYVAQGKNNSHVFLKEGYNEFHLLEKDALVVWQERFVQLAFSSQKPEQPKTSKGPSSDDAPNFSEEE